MMQSLRKYWLPIIINSKIQKYLNPLYFEILWKVRKITGQIISNVGKQIILDRAYNSSPTKSAPSQFKVGTGTTDPNAIDTDLETPVDIDGDNFKNFESGFPLIDDTALTAEMRCKLLVTDANGNSLTEFGLVNSDGSPLLFSRSVFTAITKNNTTEITLIQKDTYS